MIIEFKCKLCGRLATRDVKAYKKGVNVCIHCVPDYKGGKPVNVHVNNYGVPV